MSPKAVHLKRDEKFYQGQILCKLAAVADNLTIKPLKTEPTIDTDNTEVKVVLYRSKLVQLSAPHDNENVEQSIISHGSLENLEMPSKKVVTSLMHKLWGQSSILAHDIDGASMQDGSGSLSRAGNNHSKSSLINRNIGSPRRKRSSTTPVLCNACEMTTELYIKESMRFSYLRHRNIVMMLGYCCKENINILVYEYICNRSLEWHLFDQAANVLEWHQRHAIAIGTAKGLRFLHEECRSSPIIHRDLRPSNILLTHDFVPMLGDFGLAKWKTNDSPIQTRILGTLGYLAPEYAENGMVSVRTDVYAYGITLLQLISGRKAVSSN